MSRGAGLLLVALLLFPSAAAAQQVPHSFVCPTAVQAQSDGSFSFEVVFTFGSTGGSFAAWTELATLNVDGGGLIADGFCIIERPAGYEMRFSVSRALIDPTQPGIVDVEFSVCSEDPGPNSWAQEVAIVPTVPEWAFTVPDRVSASPAGEFSVPMTLLVAGPGAYFGSAELIGIENAEGGTIADGLCLPESFHGPGETMEVVLGHTLTDPTRGGRVRVGLSICAPFGPDYFWQAEVIVDPFVVATERENLSRLKASFGQ